MSVVALAGGVGGAKLAAGLARVLPSPDLTILVNTGDDFDHLGLRICPDLDTVMYTLAGVANPETGWGRQGDTWHFLERLRAMGAPTWFRIGDRDLDIHLERTRRLRMGEPLSSVTAGLARSLGVEVSILPMTDDHVATIVVTEDGDLAFQEYFVAHGFRPRVRGFRFDGIDSARPAPGALEAIRQADVVVLCPSNPWVSLDPILAVPGVRAEIEGRAVIGVSPIVGGRAIKGPAAKMFSELGIEPTGVAVAQHYRGLLGAWVMDKQDADLAAPVRQLGIDPVLADTVMRSPADRKRLAQVVLREAKAKLLPRTAV